MGSLATTLKLTAFFGVLMLGAVGACWVTDVISGERAQDFAWKTLALLGVFALAHGAIVLVAGGKRDGSA